MFKKNQSPVKLQGSEETSTPVRSETAEDRMCRIPDISTAKYHDEHDFLLSRSTGALSAPGGRDKLVVKVSDRDWHVTSSSLVPLKTRCVGEQCTLNLSRAQTSSRWCDMVFRRGDADSGVLVT
ncbi:hypothetical protein TNCV_426651 [Trichonephila clavipes]|nr:hypothetical protein TNCV_426651 [Trichonephila clavipes]